MKSVRRFLPFLDLLGRRPPDWRRDLGAALSVTFLSIPQGVAFALIAGLPPTAGLYACAVPAVVGGLFRSSPVVVSGPSNAVSLLVGTAVAAASQRAGMPPVQVAITLAAIVGVLQLAAGLGGLGVIADYVSRSVVLGYLTGAAVLIAVGQLPHLTGTEAASGSLPARLVAWVEGLHHVHGPSLVLGVGATALVIALRRLAPRLPAALIALVLGVVATLLLGLEARGVRVSGDIASVPRGLPPLSMPGELDLYELAPLAIAITVLSLVESTAVGRSLAARRGERLDANADFTGQGLANLAAAFTSGMPVSGSLSRSALNHAEGAASRMAGTLSGLFVLLTVLMAGPLLDHVPIPVLAGILVAIAIGMLDWEAMAVTVRTGPVDAAAFLTTVMGTFLARLDVAIYLGVGISVVLFLRRARLLRAQELRVDANGQLREFDLDDPGGRACPAVRILHLEGSLFFGAVGELRSILEEAADREGLETLIVRIKRCHDLDATTATAFAEEAEAFGRRGRRLLLVGLRPRAMEVLEASGAASRLGRGAIFPTRAGWFAAMEEAVREAVAALPEHAECPLRVWLAMRKRMGPVA